SPAPPQAAAAPPSTAAAPAASAQPPVEDDDPAFDPEYDASFNDLISEEPASVGGGLADPRSFDEVIALASERRDMMLKLQLEDRVSLVKFDAATGSIDLFLLPGAPAQLANELREKLNAWTQRKWVVVLSKAAGDRPRGEVRREREAAELEALKAHPAVKAVLDLFPDAKIAEIRELSLPPRDETGTG
ncbi:MAG: DNA polymerase III subunit gamma/tau, partial [Hyphomicrobium sp.]|nr:DNA polymerase III subunit gamma/tau [Hyphomicrobium sp.]